MDLRFFPRRRQRRDKGFALMEVVVAAGFSAVALSASLVILNRQSEIAQKARDLAMIQAAVNQDINAVRHAARIHWWKNSYYKDATINGDSPPNEMIYEPVNECVKPALAGWMERMFTTDIVGYKAYNRNVDFNIPYVLPGVSGFQIKRAFVSPSQPNQISTTVSAIRGEEETNTVRVVYSVSSVKTGPDGVQNISPYPFKRSVDVLLPVQFYC